jgi:hypothetical protein
MKASSTLLFTGFSAMLAACAGASVSTLFAPPGGPPNTRHVHKVFKYARRPQKFVVPSGVHTLAITAKGAGGASTGPIAGLGAAVTATISVTPGETLTVYVGGEGTIKGGGFNGGGNPGSRYAGGGGGASDVRQRGNTMPDRVVVAGGGGGTGAGAYYSGRSIPGGMGGDAGKTGRPGGGGGSSSYGESGGGGAGASQTAGGRGGSAGLCPVSCYVKRDSYNPDSYGGCDGSNGNDGKFGSGGIGAASCDEPGGGGGGGYYGGGGGGSSAYLWTYEYPSGYSYSEGAGGGGGAGSSYAEKSAMDVKYQRGVQSGDGEVVISTPP